MSDSPVKTSDFKPLAPVVNVYELRSDRHYVVICGPKKFDYDLAFALLKHVRESGLNVSIIATTEPNGLQFHEEKTEAHPDKYLFMCQTCHHTYPFDDSEPAHAYAKLHQHACKDSVGLVREPLPHK